MRELLWEMVFILLRCTFSVHFSFEIWTIGSHFDSFAFEMLHFDNS